MPSIRRRLLASVVVTLAAGALLALPLTYLVTLSDIDELFDERLRQVALSVAASRAGAAARPASAPRAAEDEDIELVTEVWDVDGRRIFSTHPEAGLPMAAQPGLSSFRVHGDGWRVYAVVADGQVVQAAQPDAERADIALDAAWNLGTALLAIFAAVGAVLVLALRRALGSLDRAAAAVGSRNEVSLAPIDPGQVPVELVPLVDAIDGLLRRLDRALRHQRRFVADAAHELRTPVTALSLQWSLLHRAPDAATRERAVAELGTGIARMQRLVRQLLDLSRAEPDAPMESAPVDLGALVHEVAAEFAPLAAQRGITIEVRAAPALAVSGDRHALATLLRNLVDNALHHAAGPVCVAALAIDGHPALVVRDAGPGVPAGERARVLDRFHRRIGAAGPLAEVGSGLGLAIVQAVADRHHASLMLADGPEGRGLEVRIVF